MNVMTKESDNKKSQAPTWYALTAGALFGFTGVYIGEDLITGGANGQSVLDVISVSQIAALLVAFVVLVCAVIVAIGFAVPRIGMAMNLFEDRDQWEDERTMMWLSALGCGAYGAVMVMLALADQFGFIQSVPALVAIGVLMLIFFYSAWRLVHEYDELWNEVNSETCTYGMYLTLIIGGTWSAAAHLEFIPSLSALDWITLLTFASLVGAVLSTKKRGMLDD